MSRKSSTKYIHVNQHKIRANLKHGTNEPVITIKEGRKNTYCHEVEILGPSKVIYGEDGEIEYGGSSETKNKAVFDLEYMVRVYFEGGYSDYEENRKKRLGDVSPKRIKYRKLKRD